MRWVVLLAAMGPSTALAADVGGWFAEQQKAAARDASVAVTCPNAVARAAAEATPQAAYQAAHCYLQADPPDLVAAKAWLARSAEMNFQPAQRLLRSLLAVEAGAHGAARHCHDLGEGRQLCHGGTRASPVAAATR